MKQHLTSLKKVLDGKRTALEEEIQRELRERKRIAVDQTPADAVELMMDSAQREITIHELENKSHLLRNIRDALESDRRRHVWILRLLRRKDCRKAPGGCAMDPFVHRLPGATRTELALGIAIVSANVC
jgi:hypothetical protein